MQKFLKIYSRENALHATCKMFCWQIHFAFWKVSQVENNDENQCHEILMFRYTLSLRKIQKKIQKANLIQRRCVVFNSKSKHCHDEETLFWRPCGCKIYFKIKIKQKKNVVAAEPLENDQRKHVKYIFPFMYEHVFG